MATKPSIRRGTGGRPPICEVEERRKRLIDVATELFISQGYEATSLEQIAHVAGASKTTIYRNFGDKAALFKIVADRLVDPLWPQMTDLDTEGKSPEEVLTAFGRIITSDALMNTKPIAMMRLIYRESPRFPEIARIYAESEQVPLDAITRYIARATDQHGWRIGDPAWAASQFVDLVWGRWSRHVIIGSIPIPDQSERIHIVASAVALFLNGVASGFAFPQTPRIFQQSVKNAE